MFGIGGNELLIIAVFALIIFGPDKIPEIARTAGKAIQMFKKAQADVEHVIKTEIYPAADILDPLGLRSSGADATTTAATTQAPPAEQAGAIWAAAIDSEDEEGEEE